MNSYLMYIEEALLQFRICLSQEEGHVVARAGQGEEEIMVAVQAEEARKSLLRSRFCELQHGAPERVVVAVVVVVVVLVFGYCCCCCRCCCCLCCCCCFRR